MKNELQGEVPSLNEFTIFNTDNTDGEGTHWTCNMIKNNKSYYFDSYGLYPFLEVQKYLSNIKERFYNSFQIQRKEEVICGHYCLYVIFCLNNGMNFYDTLSELYKYSKEN